MADTEPGRRPQTLLSPLRYPGGKRRLASYIADVIKLNDLQPALFVEPFAGGASVGLQLLHDNVVENLLLGESDPLVASFWKTVFHDADWLIEQMYSLTIDLDTWEEFKGSKPRSTRQRALKCLFLNRTSFSGILSPTAGPLGGWDQKSAYPVDCRFPLETIEKRIRQASALRGRVLGVLNEDWRDTIRRVQALGFREREVFYYLDPPFYEKADRLYRHFFVEKNHRALHNRLVQLKQPWLLSYDPAPQVLKMYAHNGTGPQRIDSLYSSSRFQEVQELIITNLDWLPKRTRIWRSHSEWNLQRTRSRERRTSG